MPHDPSVKTLAAILRADNEARPVFMLGAGASFSSQVPLAEKCVKLLARRVYAERELGGKVHDYQVRQIEWSRWLESHEWFNPDPDRLADNFPLVVQHLLRPQDYRRKQLGWLLQPTIEGVSPGYKALSDLVLKGLVRTVLTTNFDACLPTALHGLRPHISQISEVNRAPDDLREFDIYSRAQIIWMHGRIESYADKNLIEETAALDPQLKQLLIPFLRSSPLIVMGYRGAEASISRDLLFSSREAAMNFPRGVYWCTREGETLHPNVQDLANALGQNFEHLEIKGFDEAVIDLREALRDEDLYKGRSSPSPATGQEAFADRPASNAVIGDLDLDLALATLQTYCNNLGRSPVTRDTLLPLLRDLRLTAMDDGVERPTNGAVLLFASNLERWFPHAFVSVSIDGKRRVLFEGNLLVQRRGLLGWLEAPDINPALKIKKISHHDEEPTYSPRALVELLINMLVHRDYERIEPSVVRLTPGKEIEFRNPGGLAEEVRKKIEFDEHGHFLQVPTGHARNASLCDIFTGIRAMEWRGTGLPDVIKLAQAAGGEAVFSIDPKNEFLARMTQRPSSSGVARDDRPTGVYVLNSLPFVAMPDAVSIVTIRGQVNHQTVPGLDKVGTFIVTRDDELWSFTPLPILTLALGPLVATSRTERRADLEADRDRRRVLSWLLRHHLERHIVTFLPDGLEREDRKNAKRAYFVGESSGPRALRYDSAVRRNIRREVVKRRAEGEKAWFENEGFGYEVRALGDQWAVRIKPFYMFTGVDARTPLPSFARTARATRRMKFDRNDSVDSDLTFWSRFLSRGQPTINIGQEGTSELLLDGSFMTVEVHETAEGEAT
ncbi:MAG: SIR2 family protein [Inquilinus sp.]|uniref:SIR2 family protein n=1 Tax=Inquilinus sp. TaxID=1932117 RepID=UPI003F35E043